MSLIMRILSVELARPTFSSLLLKHSWNSPMPQVACDLRLPAVYIAVTAVIDPVEPQNTTLALPPVRRVYVLI